MGYAWLAPHGNTTPKIRFISSAYCTVSSFGTALGTRSYGFFSAAPLRQATAPHVRGDASSMPHLLTPLSALSLLSAALRPGTLSPLYPRMTSGHAGGGVPHRAIQHPPPRLHAERRALPLGGERLIELLKKGRQPLHSPLALRASTRARAG